MIIVTMLRAANVLNVVKVAVVITLDLMFGIYMFREGGT